MHFYQPLTDTANFPSRYRLKDFSRLCIVTISSPAPQTPQVSYTLAKMETPTILQESYVSDDVLKSFCLWGTILSAYISGRPEYIVFHPSDSVELLALLHYPTGHETHPDTGRPRMLLMVENMDSQPPPWRIEDSKVYQKLRNMDLCTGIHARSSYGMLDAGFTFVIFKVTNSGKPEFRVGDAERLAYIRERSTYEAFQKVMNYIFDESQRSTYKYAPTRQDFDTSCDIIEFTPMNALQMCLPDETSTMGSRTPSMFTPLPHSSVNEASITSQPQHLLPPLPSIGYPQHLPSTSNSSQLAHGSAAASSPGPSVGPVRLSSPVSHIITSPQVSQDLRRFPSGSHPDGPQHTQPGTPRLHPQGNTVVPSPAPRVSIASPGPRTTRSDTPQSSRR